MTGPWDDLIRDFFNRVDDHLTREFLHPKLRAAGVEDAESYEVVYEEDHDHYLSTACHHGQHAYCQADTGAAGTKVPGKCKFCPAKCSCHCHLKETT